MNLEDLRVQLEEDLNWRSDEMRFLRNELLSQSATSEDWPVAAIRALLVVQYAHLEGFTQTGLSLYIDAINDSGVASGELRGELFSAIFAQEFRALRSGSATDSGGADDERLLRRVKRQVALIDRFRAASSGCVPLTPSEVVSLEMNLGSEVLKKNLYLLGIPLESFPASTYSALEFFRRTRNDVGHGGRRENIQPGLFEAHWRKCEQYMGDLVRLLTQAVREEWYRAAA